MPKIKYQDISFSPEKLKRIEIANQIITEYHRQGFDLTLRQLYYQHVARGFIANNVKEYNRLGVLVSDARMAGLVDWDRIVDRTRNVMANRHWEKPSQLVQEAEYQYAIDKWANQPSYVEVWVEKDALKDVIAHAASPLDCPFFSCRGYNSQSEAWAASQRLLQRIQKGKIVHIIHLGDHDPSGIDMSRDIKARLSLFTDTSVHVLRIALNMPQIRRYNPPPNPAKTTDSRYADYAAKYGEESWELDALEPRVLVDLINRAINQYRDPKLWAESVKQEARGRNTLHAIHANFTRVVKFLREKGNETNPKDLNQLRQPASGSGELPPSRLPPDPISL